MALTRRMLKALGIEDEKAEEIISAHIESTDALKAQRDEYKAQLEAKPAPKQEPKAEPSDEYKEKFEATEKAFEDFKAKVEGEKAAAQKKALYRDLIAKAGVDAKRIDAVLKISDLDSVEVADGAIKDADKLVEGIKADFADFIPVITTEGASVAKPPAGDGGTAAPKTLRDALRERYEQKG
ncbi:hypothetical protein [uncultured Slackia sp.]|uniref:phage scaffolding protein n=1 Tax=uncultured Slackia sp. TaxID=665903 RepID=UPI0025DC763A|nr:hypothetical protein [uncultured Slackia sp.]